MGLFMMVYSYVVAIQRDYPLQPRARLASCGAPFAFPSRVSSRQRSS